MRRDVDNENLDSLRLHAIDHAILLAKSRGPMALPLAAQDLVLETFYQPQTLRTRHPDDVFPLLIPRQDIDGNAVEPPRSTPVLENFPHTAFELYHI